MCKPCKVDLEREYSRFFFFGYMQGLSHLAHHSLSSRNANLFATKLRNAWGLSKQQDEHDQMEGGRGHGISYHVRVCL